VGIGAARPIVDGAVALHDERDAEPQQLRARGQIIVQERAIGMQKGRALRDVRSGRRGVAQQGAALELAIEMGGLGGLADEDADILHEHGIEAALERNRRDDRRHQRRDRRDERKQRHHSKMQPCARPPGASRGDEVARLEPDQHEQNEDDEAVAAENRQNDEGRRNDRREPGEDDESRDGEKQGGRDRQRPKASRCPAFFKATRVFRAFSRAWAVHVLPNSFAGRRRLYWA